MVDIDRLKDVRHDFRKGDAAAAKRHFQEKLSFTTGPVELSSAIQKGADVNLIDVRQREDYEKGHLPGAVSLPKEEWHTVAGLSGDKVNVVYCYSTVCHLAARAALFFADKGFSVMELEGGFKEWRVHDLPVDKGAGKAAA